MAKTAAKVSAGDRRSFHVGINDYPYDGSDLNGCVNDAHAWAELLIDIFGFPRSNVTILTDADATRKRILDGLKSLLAGARSGDVLVFTNSSHGSYVADTDGDEPKYDEILCPYDIADNHIVDDELRNLFDDLPAGVSLSVVLDNCFSGTATRAALDDIIPGLRTPDERRVRFLSPALRGMKVLENPWTAQPKGKETHPQSRMKDILLSGCTDREYSYDAYLGGTYHGAMTYYATDIIRRAKGKLTYSQLHTRLLNAITDYPQHPQLEGKAANKKKMLFS